MGNFYTYTFKFSTKTSLFLRVFACIFILISYDDSFSQNRQLDSLKKIILSENDSTRIKQLIEIATLFNDIQLDSADKYIDLASEILKKSTWQRGVGLVNLTRGHYYFRAGLYDQALKEYYLAQTVFEKTNDLFNIASIKIYIGTLLTYIKRYDSGKPFLFDALRISKQFKNQSLYAVSLGNIGNYYLKIADFEQAVFYLKSCLEIINSGKTDKLKKLPRTVAGNNMLAVSYLYVGQPDSSKICENLCEQIGEQIGNYHNLFDMYAGISEYHLKNSNYSNAMAYARKALEKAQKLNAIEKISASYKLIYESEKKLGNESAALKHLELYNILEDSIQRTNSAKQIAILINKEESEHQKSKIQELTIQNLSQSKDYLLAILIISIASILFFLWQSNRLKIKNKALIEKNKEISEAMLKGQTLERKRVAVDLHDNLGSTLSSIQWSLKAFDKSKMDNEEKEVYQNLSSMLKDAYNQVRLLSHNMLPEEFEKHGLVPALKYFIKKTNQNSVIKFELEIQDSFSRLDNNIEFELYSICLELINNIVKYSNGNEAKIVLKIYHKTVNLIISENGKGITHINNEGKGLKNIQARVDSLDGKWKTQYIENVGYINEIAIKI